MIQISRGKDIESFNKLREVAIKISNNIQQYRKELADLESNLLELKEENRRKIAPLKRQLENTSIKRKSEQDQYNRCKNTSDKSGASQHIQRINECNAKYSIIRSDIKRFNDEIEEADKKFQEKVKQIDETRKKKEFILSQMRLLYTKITGKSADTLTRSH